MKHRQTLATVGVIACSTVLAVAGVAQSRTEMPYPARPVPPALPGKQHKSEVVPPTVLTAEPPAASPSSASIRPIEYLAGNQMPAADRALADRARPSIEQLAATAGMGFAQGDWHQEQLVCRALPNHMFLIDQKENGVGDRSLFSISIPRSGRDRVRILPILRQGYTLYTEAPVNDLSIAAFNRIRENEPAQQSADWLATSLCYAALTGARPEIPADKTHNRVALYYPSMLAIDQNGVTTVRFVDETDPARPMTWVLTFSRKGQLQKVQHEAAPVYEVRPFG
jgi:hypothetical protein